jgi:hypothetical protein
MDLISEIKSPSSKANVGSKNLVNQNLKQFIDNSPKKNSSKEVVHDNNIQTSINQSITDSEALNGKMSSRNT